MNASAIGDVAGATLRGQASAWWQARAARERQALALVAGVLGAFVVWSLAIQPALLTLREAPAELDRLEARYQQMQRVASESGVLRGATRVSPAQASTALKSATARLGDRATLLVQGDRATLTLNGVSADALRAWLSEARNGARARPVDAQLQRGPLGFSGTLGVTLGGTS